MKKTMVLLTILFTASASAMGGMSIVPKVSLNYVENTDSSDLSMLELDPEFDFGLGVDLVFDVNENIKWFTGISYQRFLSRLKSVTIAVEGAYLDVPIGVQMYVSETIYIPISFNALVDVGTKGELAACYGTGECEIVCEIVNSNERACKRFCVTAV